MRSFKKYKCGDDVIEVVEWTGKNVTEVDEFFESYEYKGPFRDWKECVSFLEKIGQKHPVPQNWYFIKDSNGVIYSCSPDRFEEEYSEIIN